MGSGAIVQEETVIWLVLALSLACIFLKNIILIILKLSLFCGIPAYFHLVVSAINQFCRVLQIRAFKVKDFSCKHRLFLHYFMNIYIG